MLSIKHYRIVTLFSPADGTTVGLIYRCETLDHHTPYMFTISLRPYEKTHPPNAPHCSLDSLETKQKLTSQREDKMRWEEDTVLWATEGNMWKGGEEARVW